MALDRFQDWRLGEMAKLGLDDKVMPKVNSCFHGLPHPASQTAGYNNSLPNL